MTDAIQKAREALASIPHGAIDALANNQRQLDMDGCEVGVSRQAVDEVLAGLRAALDALDAETEGWRTDTMPTLERVMVAGWQPRSGTTRGYWWYGEDATDEKGMPIDHPNATLWIRLTDLLPAFPPEARS